MIFPRNYNSVKVVINRPFNQQTEELSLFVLKAGERLSEATFLCILIRASWLETNTVVQTCAKAQAVKISLFYMPEKERKRVSETAANTRTAPITKCVLGAGEMTQP